MRERPFADFLSSPTSLIGDPGIFFVPFLLLSSSTLVPDLIGDPGDIQDPGSFLFPLFVTRKTLDSRFRGNDRGEGKAEIVNVYAFVDRVAMKGRHARAFFSRSLPFVRGGQVG